MQEILILDVYKCTNDFILPVPDAVTYYRAVALGVVAKALLAQNIPGAIEGGANPIFQRCRPI